MKAIDEAQSQKLILCGGLQSGGTTIVSWCFLQRRDTDGVLDMRNDIIAGSFSKATAPVVWAKVTIGSFRLNELNELYRYLGWKTQALLIVRDVRSTYSSLKSKTYGINGATAEEPPLIVRFMRFLEDWRVFRDQGWPILKFEDFLLEPRLQLTSLCYELCLEWDEAMLSWPKALTEISYVGKPNRTFLESLSKGSAFTAICADKRALSVNGLAAREKDWLEQVFTEYNEYHGYPPHVPFEDVDCHVDTTPRFLGTRRQRTRATIDRLQDVLRVAQNPTTQSDEGFSKCERLLAKLRNAADSLSGIESLEGLVE